MQKFNYHTHVWRCGHAIGTEEEMIQAAIEAGFETIGISDHLPFLGWINDRCRMPMEQMEEYLTALQELKEKYKDQIKVRIGFETEFFDDRIDWLEYIKSRCDYLICGQHNPTRDDPDYNVYPHYLDDSIRFMASQVCHGIELGLFKYIAHPDYFLLAKCEVTEGHKEAFRKIAKCAKQHDVVLEINIKGCRYGKQQYKTGIESYLYPNTEYIKILSEVGCKVCFGYDAHSPEMLKCRELEEELRVNFKSYNLNYVDDLVL